MVRGGSSLYLLGQVVNAAHKGGDVVQGRNRLPVAYPLTHLHRELGRAKG